MDYHDIKAEADDGAVGTSYGKEFYKKLFKNSIGNEKIV